MALRVVAVIVLLYVVGQSAAVRGEVNCWRVIDNDWLVEERYHACL